MTDSPSPIDPTRAALLVMDYQDGVLAMIGDDAAPLLDRAGETIAQVRERGGQVAYVRVGFADGEAPSGPMAARVGDRARTMFHADAPATQIHERIAPREGDIVVRKTRVGPFGTTDLDEQLRARGVDTLIMCGISTSGCVLSAVRDGHDRDYRLVVVSDLCADHDDEAHSFLLERIFPRQADVVTTAELGQLLS
jgi:nicotinamidase-related amidase